MRRVELDLNKIQSIEAAHQYLREQIAFTEDYGDGLDELHDMLMELSENICVELLECTDQESPMYEYGKELERVMEDVAQTAEYTGDGKMFAVFADFESLDLESW